MSSMPARSGAIATTNIWFGVGAPADRFVIPEARRAASAPTTVADDLLRGVPARAPATKRYREWNFAPSGEWAAYDFTGYREGMTDAEVARRPTSAWRTISPGGRSARRSRSMPRRSGSSGLSAVLEEKDGTKSYWALAHPAGDKPDFHDAGLLRRAACLKQRCMTLFGIDRLLAEPELAPPARRQARRAARPSGVGHARPDPQPRRAGRGRPQASPPRSARSTALRGDKQDNMVESDDFTDPVHGIPVFSLYGEVRRPTGQSMGTFDTILIDLQDLGCRIYTFITTLLYVLEAAAEHGKSVWVLDRPNPAGRPVEGLTLRPGWESFVGAGPIPMRHGLTLGELGHWFVDHFKLDVDYRVIEMEGWQPDAAPGFGWPPERVWINPSPNAANLNMARAYAGTVMLEGTTLSEGRGTTRPLELFGAPDLEPRRIMAEMERARARLARRLQAARRHLPADLPQACRRDVPRRLHPRRRAVLRSRRHSSRGGCRRSPSRRSAASIRTTICGATSPTNMCSTSSRSTSSTARRCCANGSTTRAPTPGDLDALTIPDERAWEEERKAYLLY